MSAPSLKDSLMHWTGFPPLERSFEPRKTRRAAAKAEQLLGEAGRPRAPANYDLSALHCRVVECWRRDHSLAQLAPRDLRQLPWILFYPPQGKTADWLGAEPAVLQEYGRWLCKKGSSRPALVLLREFLRVYPTALSTFNDLRRLLQGAVQDGTSPPPPSLRQWRQRCRDFGLLDSDGAAEFVQRLMLAEDAPKDFLRQAGFDVGLAHCGFLKSGILGRLPRAWAPRGEQLGRLLALLTYDGRLRFDDLVVRAKTADALLHPFAERPADPALPALKKRLQPFFLRYFGDPRLPSGKHGWAGIPDTTRSVVIRWLNERALEQFFQLVKETALDRHWRFREAFWRAFLRLSPDIWFVLGRSARTILRKMNAQSDEPETTADLQGAQSNQSVLLLRLPGVTIAEWSHNGPCRFWLEGNPDAPMLYKDKYSRPELRREADFRQRHDGSANGRWQDEIMDWLRENMGIEIERAEYFPDRLERQRDYRFRRKSTYW